MRCASCDAELPEGALFCIQCGAPVERASTGATERLPERTGGPRCPACGTVNPSFAAYCVNCGRALGEGQEAGATRPTLAPVPPRAVQPQAAPAPFEVPAVPRAPTPPAIPRPRRRRSEVAGGIGGGLFLIGLALLFATGTFWPGILVLVGITAFISATASGETAGGIVGGTFMVGMAFLFATDTFWPGILVLLGLVAIMSAVLKPGRRKGI